MLARINYNSHLADLSKSKALSTFNWQNAPNGVQQLSYNGHLSQLPWYLPLVISDFSDDEDQGEKKEEEEGEEQQTSPPGKCWRRIDAGRLGNVQERNGGALWTKCRLRNAFAYRVNPDKSGKQPFMKHMRDQLMKLISKLDDVKTKTQCRPINTSFRKSPRPYCGFTKQCNNTTLQTQIDKDNFDPTAKTQTTPVAVNNNIDSVRKHAVASCLAGGALHNDIGQVENRQAGFKQERRQETTPIGNAQSQAPEGVVSAKPRVHFRLEMRPTPLVPFNVNQESVEMELMYKNAKFLLQGSAIKETKLKADPC